MTKSRLGRAAGAGLLVKYHRLLQAIGMRATSADAAGAGDGPVHAASRRPSVEADYSAIVKFSTVRGLHAEVAVSQYGGERA